MKLLYITRNVLVLSLLFSTVTSKAFDNKTIAKTDTSATAGADSSGTRKADVKATANAAPQDTAWKPVRRLWGLTFGDFYYDQHADAGGRGAENNYAGVPTGRNAFQFRRIYLGYDYDIDRRFSVELLLSSEPTANTAVSGTTSISNGDNLADNKMSFFIKLANLKWKNIWKGTDFVLGEQVTPLTGLLGDNIWGYRFVERTVADLHKSNTYDLGAGLRGVFDPATQNFGYDLLIGNNSQAVLGSAASANTGFFKEFYGDIYAKFLDKRLIFDLYADDVQTASSTPATAATPYIGQQSHSLVKGLVAYTTPIITFGVEAYTNKLTNGVTTTVGKVITPADATVQAISFYARGAIYKDKIAFFVRYDNYNPDNDFVNGDVYTVKN